MTNQNDLPKTSAPAQRALESAGITSLKQLTEVTEEDLLQLHGMGQKALGILREDVGPAIPEKRRPAPPLHHRILREQILNAA